MKILHTLVPFVSVMIAAAACGSSDDGSAGSVPDPGTSGAPGSSGSAGNPGTSGSPGSSGTSGSGTSGTSGSSGNTPAPLTIFTIVMENHDYAEIVGNKTDAPFFNTLIDDYGLATNYQDSGTHPSLPNYLQMISGDPQYPGVFDLSPTTYPFPVAKENLGTQLEAAKIPWRSYQETMGTPCNMNNKTGATGDYAPKHDPFLYFTDMAKTTAGLCANRNVDYSAFAADLAAGTYRYMWITPNLTNDGHDPTGSPGPALKASDTWAKTNIEAIMASAVYKANGIIFLTWDEAEGRTPGAGSKDQVPMIVISPNIKSKGFKSAKAYSHKSYLATVEDLLKLPRLATVASEPVMTEFFK